jgi:hypothetical protein
MKYLIAIIDDYNRRSALFGDPQIDGRNITQEQADALFQKIEGDLSPENLTCDGEAPAKYVRQRKMMLEGALRDLKTLGFKPKHFA